MGKTTYKQAKGMKTKWNDWFICLQLNEDWHYDHLKVI